MSHNSPDVIPRLIEGESPKLIAMTKTHGLHVVKVTNYFEQDEDSEYSWSTACSEGWAIDKADIIWWCYADEVQALLEDPATEDATSLEKMRYKSELYEQVWGRAMSMGYMNVTMGLNEAAILRERDAEAQNLIKELLNALPSNKDWLDPTLEARLNDFTDGQEPRSGQALPQGGRAKRLSALRKIMGDTPPTEFAHKHDLDVAKLKQILAGEQAINEALAERLAKAIGVPRFVLTNPGGKLAIEYLSREYPEKEK